jgi:hypothetical protein
MFSAKVIFNAMDFDTQEKKIIEYSAQTFSEALQMADLIINNNSPKPFSIEILEDNRIVASLRTIK